MSVRSLFLALLAFSSSAVSNELRHEIAPQTGIEAWHWQGRSMQITFRQRLPDQSRAYFQARGFTPEQAERIALSCVFQTEIRNTASDSAVAIGMREWRIIGSDRKPRPPQLETAWAAEWEAMQATSAARIAFRWSLFPEEQQFEAGDWNMGMVTMGLAPGSPFDLEVVWRREGEIQSARLPGLRCASDRQL